MAGAAGDRVAMVVVAVALTHSLAMRDGSGAGMLLLLSQQGNQTKSQSGADGVCCCRRPDAKWCYLMNPSEPDLLEYKDALKRGRCPEALGYQLPAQWGLSGVPDNCQAEAEVARPQGQRRVKLVVYWMRHCWSCANARKRQSEVGRLPRSIGASIGNTVGWFAQYPDPPLTDAGIDRAKHLGGPIRREILERINCRQILDEYTVVNTELQSQRGSLRYRYSKSLEAVLTGVGANFVPEGDGWTRVVHVEVDGVDWGSTVEGVSEGDGWVRVGEFYLPERIEGRTVLVRTEPSRREACLRRVERESFWRWTQITSDVAASYSDGYSLNSMFYVESSEAATTTNELARTSEGSVKIKKPLIFSSGLARAQESAVYNFPGSDVHPIPYVAEEGDTPDNRPLPVRRQWERLQRLPNRLRDFRSIKYDVMSEFHPGRGSASHEQFLNFMPGAVEQLVPAAQPNGDQEEIHVVIVSHSGFMRDSLPGCHQGKKDPDYKPRNNEVWVVTYEFVRGAWNSRLEPIPKVETGGGKQACERLFSDPAVFPGQPNRLCEWDVARCTDRVGFGLDFQPGSWLSRDKSWCKGLGTNLSTVERDRILNEPYTQSGPFKVEGSATEEVAWPDMQRVRSDSAS